MSWIISLWENNMSKINLQRLGIRNYRNIREADLDFSEGAIGLIGVNASGKTNIGRAFIFLCDQVRSTLPHIGGPTRADTPLSRAEWPPLKNFDPAALLYAPEAGREITLSITLDVPASFIPNNKGQNLQDLNRDQQTYSMEITATFRCTDLPTGAHQLVPSFQVRVDSREIVRDDLKQLNDLLQTINGSRLQALHPALDFLTVMNNLSNKDVKGHNTFERLNTSVLGLDPDFARVRFLNNTPMAIEGDIPDLSVENMSTGNLRALELLSVSKNPELKNTILVHIEEPETHFHPSLQREVIHTVLDNCRKQNLAVIIETHSAQVLRELYANGVLVYRVEIAERNSASGTRISSVTELPHNEEAVNFLADMGVDVGFSLLGGITVITDGVTDLPAYRAFFSQFDYLRNYLISFIPIGCLEARNLDLSGIALLSGNVVVIADGHFQEQHGERLGEDCKNAGIEFVQLEHWGAENFLTERALRKAAENIPQIQIDDNLELDPMISLRDTDGIDGFSKNHHMAAVAAHVKREELVEQPDFKQLVEKIKELARVS